MTPKESERFMEKLYLEAIKHVVARQIPSIEARLSRVERVIFPKPEPSIKDENDCGTTIIYYKSKGDY